MAATTAHPIESHRRSFPGEFTPSAAEVREQLAHLLDSPLFRTSTRYPVLLRYVVERKLDGHIEFLKERTLGVEVFGRRADYDTNQDPVVRVSAAEIRKRIAQYYHEPGHETELRIELPLGAYIPEFLPAPRAIADEPLLEKAPAKVVPIRSYFRMRKTHWILAAALCPCALFLSLRGTPPLDSFWRPIFDSSSPVSLCVARSPFEAGQIVDPSRFDSRAANIAWPDAMALAKLSAFVQAKKQRYYIRREDQATFDDFRRGPSVLIGGFNDSWSLRLMNDGRFSFQHADGVCWIRDQQNPSQRRWSINLRNVDAQGRPIISEDYAIISRVSHPKTGSTLVLVAGLWGYGTEAAADFLTNPRYFELLSAQAPANWEKKNMQIVISTEVIDRSPSPPKTLAVHFW